MRRTCLVLTVVLTLAGCVSTPSRSASQSASPSPSSAGPAVVAVFLSNGATDSQKQEIEEEVRTAPGATRVRFVTREEAYRRLKKTFDDSELTESVEPSDLSESYRARLAELTEARETAAALRRLPGVESVDVTPVSKAKRSPSP